MRSGNSGKIFCEKRKLYRSMGILGGIFVAVFFLVEHVFIICFFYCVDYCFCYILAAEAGKERLWR